MPSDEQVACDWIAVRPDGQLHLSIDGRSHMVGLHGVEMVAASPELVEEFLGRLKRNGLPVGCTEPAVQSLDKGALTLKLSYLAWRDKSGDVWKDLAPTLIEEGLVLVAPDEFPERDEYSSLERRAKEERRGIWAAGPS
jgi:hypothetical protein